MNSKKDSFQNIVDMKTPDLIILVETKLSPKTNFSIKGYDHVMCNLKYGKEGIFIAARTNTFYSIEQVFESVGKNLMTVEISYPDQTLRIIAIHSPQETEKPDIQTDFYLDLETEIQRAVENGSGIIIAGDMNANMKSSSSPNGRHLQAIIEEYNLKTLNFDEKTEGKWTRIQKRGKSEIKSALDYIIVDQTTHESFKSMLIDENKIFTPFRTQIKKKTQHVVFTDHCALIAEFNILKGSQQLKTKREKRSIWKLTKEGLKKFHEISNQEVQLGEVSNLKNPYQVWVQNVEEIMSKCFRKITIKTKEQDIDSKKVSVPLNIRQILLKEAAKGRIQRMIVQEYFKRVIQKEVNTRHEKKFISISNTIAKMSINGSFSQDAFWKLKKKAKVKNPSEPRSVKAKNGKTVIDPATIMNEIESEFTHRLRNRDPHPGWEQFVETTNEIASLLISLDTTESPPFTMNELSTAIKKIKSGKSPGIDGIAGEILTHAGKGILDSLLLVFNYILCTNNIPDEWLEVLVVLIYKNKGSRKELVNFRGIFLTVVVSKVFERMLQARMLPSIEKISFFQSGSRSGRSVADNLFLARCAIDHSRFLKQQIILTTYDYEQAFDSLWIQECITTLHRLGVENYILRLIYELNCRAIVRVKTPFGLTPKFEVQDIVKQGGVLGQLLCSASTAEHCSLNKGVNIGTVNISSLAHVDDIMDLSGNCHDAETAHQNALKFSHLKKLTHSVKKCSNMTIFRPACSPNPHLEIDGKKIELVRLIPYLGDVFNDRGTNKDLMKDRLDRGTRASIGIEAFIRESYFGIYKICIHILLYRSIFMSSVLFNSQAWTNITNNDLRELEILQIRVLKRIVNARRMTSNAFLFLELGILPIKYEVHIRQMCFLHHIINLSEDDPVKQVWRSLRMLPDFRNWWYDIKNLHKVYEVDFSEDDVKSVTKETYNKKIKDLVTKFAQTELKKICKTQSKTRDLDFSTFEMQNYLKVLPPSMSNIIFKARSKTLDLKMHTPYLYNNTLCRMCGTEGETVVHIINCNNNLDKFPVCDVESTLKNPTNVESLRNIAERISLFFDNLPNT